MSHESANIDVYGLDKEIEQLSVTNEALGKLTAVAIQNDKLYETISTSNGLNRVSASLMQHSLESIDRQLNSFGIDISITTPSLESFSRSGNTRAATRVTIEGIKERSRSLWETIKKLFAKIWGWIRGMFAKVKGIFSNQKKKLETLEQKHEKIKKSSPELAGDDVVLNKNSFNEQGAIDTMTDIDGNVSTSKTEWMIDNIRVFSKALSDVVDYGFESLTQVIEKDIFPTDEEDEKVVAPIIATVKDRYALKRMSILNTKVSGNITDLMMSDPMMSDPTVVTYLSIKGNKSAPSEIPSLNNKDITSLNKAVEKEVGENSETTKNVVKMEKIFKEIGILIDNKAPEASKEEADFARNQIQVVNKAIVELFKLRINWVNDVIKYIEHSLIVSDNKS